MKRIALFTAAALTLTAAAPAFANDQLAASLGVADQGYSLAELTQLKAAYDDGDSARINFILDTAGAGSTTTSTKSFGSSSEQLADSLGVDASEFTRAELVALKAAVSEDDAARVEAIKTHAAQNSGDTPEARTQLGLSVGLDAMSNSRAVLVHEHES